MPDQFNDVETNSLTKLLPGNVKLMGAVTTSGLLSWIRPTAASMSHLKSLDKSALRFRILAPAKRQAPSYSP